MKKTSLLLITILITLLLMSVGCSNQEQDKEPEGGETPAQLSKTYKLPDESGEAQGISNFASLDIYGETVTNDVFSDYDLTMINIWGTFCSPCLDEMPDLGEIDAEYEDKGFNIIGVVVDVLDNNGSIDENMIIKAQEIAENTGADYLHLIPSENIINGLLGGVQYIPYTVFVDSEGNLIGEEFVGSREKEEWVEIIESML